MIAQRIKEIAHTRKTSRAQKISRWRKPKMLVPPFFSLQYFISSRPRRTIYFLSEFAACSFNGNESSFTCKRTQVNKIWFMFHAREMHPARRREQKASWWILWRDQTRGRWSGKPFLGSYLHQLYSYDKHLLIFC